MMVDGNGWPRAGVARPDLYPVHEQPLTIPASCEDVVAVYLSIPYMEAWMAAGVAADRCEEHADEFPTEQRPSLALLLAYLRRQHDRRSRNRPLSEVG